MEVITFVHEGLGNSSYLVRIQDGALLVDPDRSVDRYLRAAEERGWPIRAVLETHLHADFVSGTHELGLRRELAEAKLFVPRDAAARFPHQPIAPGDRVTLDGVAIEPVASPGHTPEHLSYVLRPPGGPALLFSGGSLIVGGAARTDLIAPELTDTLTRQQHRTLHHAFEALPDETLLYPTHGGGSFCASVSGTERSSTLGQERATNPLLAISDEDEFARWFPGTFTAAPGYFFRLRPGNQNGPRPVRQIPPPPPLTASEFSALRGQGPQIVDVRSAGAYIREHIPGALSNPFRDQFGVWLGWLLDLETPLLFVVDNEQQLSQVIAESLLVGFERFAGWLDGGMAAWASAGLPTASAEFVDGRRARRMLKDGAAALDVREPQELAAGQLPGALHVPLGGLASRLQELPRDRPLVVYCGHGERAASAVSLLEGAGFGPLANIDGGYEAWHSA